MSEEMLDELEALAVAYLTQNLKEFPNGVSIDYLERTFPEKMDETPDWYKKNFNMPSVLVALKSIPKAVRLISRGGSTFVSLNKSSDKVDQHLVDLVVGQKASSKRRRPLGGGRSHSQRVLDSFTLNRRYSSNAYNTENRFRSKFSQSQRSSTTSWSIRRSPPRSQPSHSWSRPSIYHERPARAAPNDPRAAQSSLSMVPPQIKPISTPSAPTIAHTPKYLSSSSSTKTHFTPTPLKTPVPPTKATHGTLGDIVSSQDPRIDKQKHTLRRNLIDLLTTKFDTLKVFHLSSIYKEEYKEDLRPTEFGHASMTDLLNDPYFKDCIKIIPDHPYNLIKAVNIGETNGKENISSKESNSNDFNSPANVSEPLSDTSNVMSAAKMRYNAIDPFNVKTMLQSLEPLKDIKPAPLGNFQVEEIVKYRTMRIIFKSPDMTLKLDEWELKYQIEWNSRIRIPIQDYGFKTLLEFFKHLATDIPIKIHLLKDQWVAKSDFETTSKWLKKTLAAGKYRAIMVMDKKYDYIAYPSDSYQEFDTKSLPIKSYYPVTIMSVTYPHKVWLQFKTVEAITAHLAIETSLTSYEDYKKKNTFSVPLEFIKVGFPCVAFDESQQRWCRAAVADVPNIIDDNSNITVFLVDYGVSKNLKRTSLQCILKSHLSQPVGLIYAQLFGVSEDEGKKRMARVTLQEYTNPPVLLACKILSSVHTPIDDVDIRWQSKRSIYNVKLIDTREQDCDLATAINNCTSTPEE